MEIENICVGLVVLAGLGATLSMDIWALFLRRVFNIALPNYCFVGRWLLYMPTGKFKHDSIATVERKANECKMGWFFHYLVGTAYAFILIIPFSGRWFEHPTLLPALLVGVGTVVIPFFIMQPAFGLGFAAAKSREPGQARLKSLISHAAYGVGLYLSASLLNEVVYSFPD